ncbi:MAG: GNAT family N-acetyltransferase [Methylophilus sp.]|nr:GNAT family N-acetyltransferase [Methylophilus sp.]
MLAIRRAQQADAEAIAILINSAYRGESSRAGWTTEADLIEGLRTTTQEITHLLQQSQIMILVGVLDHEVVATICCEWLQEGGQNKAKLGMIAVKPTLQNQGIGKQIIQAAELQASTEWNIQAYCMTVVTARDTLIAFYGRQGYQPTGLVKPFPYASDLWQVKVDGLQFEYFEKPISIA